MATGIKSKKNWQTKHLNINKINEEKNWCIDKDVPIHTHGLLKIVRAVIDEIAPMMGGELATEQARLLASYHLAVVSGRQIRFKIYSAQCKWRCDDDNFELFNDLGCSAKLNFLPIVNYINHIGKFEKKVENSNGNVRYTPKIDKKEPTGIEFLRQATDLSMQHAQGIPVTPKNGDVPAHFQPPKDMEGKHFDEFQKRMRNFRNPEPEVALPSFDIKKSGDYVHSRLLQHDIFDFRLRCFVEEINFEFNGSPIQLVASNGNGRAWSTSSLTTRELLLGSVYGFGERFFDVDSDIHEERIASVKYNFDTEDVTRLIVYNAMHKKNWVAEYIPRNAINESPLQIKTVPINTHRLLDIIWNVITSIRKLSKSMGEKLNTDQACMDAFYHLAVYSGHQVRMKVLLAQQKYHMKIPLTFEERKEIYTGRQPYGQLPNFQPIVDYIDHIGNFKHGNVFYVPELNMPPDGVGFLRQATDLSIHLAQSFISENGGIPAHYQWPGNIKQDYNKEFQERMSKFRLSENTQRALNFQESKQVAETLIRCVAYELDSFISNVNLEADGTKIQLVASKEDSLCWSNIDLKSGELYLGAVYGFGECFFDENSYAHKFSIAVVNNFFDNKTVFAISNIVQNDILQHMRERGSYSSSSSK